MDFNTAYEAFLEKHRKARKGERLRRLIEGHGFLEKLILENVWWPAIGHFDHLHPEYEVSDFRDGTRFLDYAFLPGVVRLNIEGDGLETHARKISLAGFDDDRIRQNHLILDGWKVLRFTHNRVKERPRLCQQMLFAVHGNDLWQAECRRIFRHSTLARRKGNPAASFPFTSSKAYASERCRRAAAS
ncbi:hypothetical protein [Cohnella silvisoli]|uniref:DUF559 domain-containing protein n=1 Tax=Cohnella silvisoli TaxID=2873699 RepID=A0ABV1KWA5_9BACL|nr:hypothetical protein [Cohnella silvisoli]